MKKVCVFFSLIFLFVFSLLSFSGCTNARIQERDVNVNMTPRMIATSTINDFEEISQTVTPAVVGISAIFGNVESVGSGVALAPNGYILTNDHVVNGAKSITIYYADKTSGNASLIWADPAMDLAIIKSNKDMPYLPMGGSDTLQTGRDIIAIGTPLTLQFKHTITKGIVSALNRTLEIDNEDGSTSYLQNLIQHDASINPGNSGGPLINSRGEVIGINTLKVPEAEGLGFAIPVEVSAPVLNKILQNGSYSTPYLGLFGLDSSIASFYGKTVEEKGVYIVNLDNAGPSAKAGLLNGDIIKKIDDYNIETMLDLRSKIYNYDIGDSIQITYLRNGKESTTQLTLASR
jgi:S1-C subfamily serine protease